jgi:UDP-GlcNAc:undecaprenyl-phosphate GlcNAc-1-phosphate transferase
MSAPSWFADLVFPGSLLLTVGLIAMLTPLARALGWVDHPSTRKHHPRPVPLVGGVAMGIAFCVGILLLPDKPHDWRVLLICTVMLTLLGLYDDLRSSRASTRFLFQTAAVLLMALGSDVVLGNLDDLFGLGQFSLGDWAVLFTLFAVVGVINAFNMIDGLDGLAGGSGLIAAGWLLVLCLSTHACGPGDIGALLILAMVIAGFLVFNLRHPWRARAGIFMGDAGSTMLGFVLSWFLIHLSQGEQAVMTPITAVWILALPLLDTLTVMVRRLRSGSNPFAADRQHLHHLLLGRGLTDGQVTGVLLALTFLTGGLGVLGDQLDLPCYLGFYAFVALILLYYRITTTMLPPPNSPVTCRDRRRPPRSNDTDKKWNRSLLRLPWIYGNSQKSE